MIALYLLLVGGGNSAKLGYLWKNQTLIHDFVVLVDLKDCEAGCWITLPAATSDSLLYTGNELFLFSEDCDHHLLTDWFPQKPASVLFSHRGKWD